jgi:hypothetical protein
VEVSVKQGFEREAREAEERRTDGTSRGRTAERSEQAQEEGSRETSGKSEIEK